MEINSAMKDVIKLLSLSFSPSLPNVNALYQGKILEEEEEEEERLLV